MPTIRDVARSCGLSVATVSRVLNNTPGPMTPETRELVLKTVRQMRYRPTAAAPHRARTGTLGIIALEYTFSARYEGGWGDQVRDGIRQAAFANNQNLVLFNPGLWQGQIHESLRIYCDGRCDALIVLGPGVGEAPLTALRERGIPFLLVGDTGDDEDYSVVDVDNGADAERLTEHLIGLGHRRIAFGGSLRIVRAQSQRYDGMVRALTRHGLPVRPDWAILDLPVSNIAEEQWRPRLDEWVDALASQPPAERPTAYLGWNDEAARRIIERLGRHGQRVPRDASVVGFDDSAQFAWFPPSLTTMRQPYQEMGDRAVGTILGLLDGSLTGPQRHLLPSELIVRETAVPPP